MTILGSCWDNFNNVGGLLKQILDVPGKPMENFYQIFGIV